LEVFSGDVPRHEPDVPRHEPDVPVPPAAGAIVRELQAARSAADLVRRGRAGRGAPPAGIAREQEVGAQSRAGLLSQLTLKKIHDVFTAITDKLFFCSSGIVCSRTGSVHRVHDA
jgi:hypothetical protein